VVAGVSALRLLRRSSRPPRRLPALTAPSVTAVIPALDEAAAIGGVLAELAAAGVDDVVVVDGGSQDETAAVARAAGARLVHEPRRGYGRACQAGAAAGGGEVIVFLDGDGSDDPAFVPLLVDEVARGSALALGVRSRREPGAMLRHQLLGTRLVTALVWLLHGVPVADVPPLRAVRRDVLDGLALREMTYGWPTEMLVKAARQGLVVTQVEVLARPRRGGRSKIAGRFAPSLLAGVRMVGVVLRHA
jgi:glycosyltransferase involved in cell wall biosynthesis